MIRKSPDGRFIYEPMSSCDLAVISNGSGKKWGKLREKYKLELLKSGNICPRAELRRIRPNQTGKLRNKGQKTKGHKTKYFQYYNSPSCKSTFNNHKSLGRSQIYRSLFKEKAEIILSMGSHTKNIDPIEFHSISEITELDRINSSTVQSGSSGWNRLRPLSP